MRRTTATLLVVGLVSYCAYLLWALLWNPKTYFVHLTASTYRPSGGQPLQFAYGDFAAFKRLAPAFAGESFPESLERPLTWPKFQEKLRALAKANVRGKDRLVVYLAAHGILEGKRAKLRFEPDVRVPVSDVLDELKASKAGTKLLILDAGQDGYNPRSGISFSAFPAALQQEIVAANDPSLWVLCAHSSFERSHVSPKAGGRSVFGRFVAEGLAGYADENEDRVVGLDELYAYVQPNVTEWVSSATGKNESQTPLLLNCDGSDESAAKIDLVSIRALPSLEELQASDDASEPQLDLQSAAFEAVTENTPTAASAMLAQRRGEESAGPGGGDSEPNGAGGQKPANTGAVASRTNTSSDGLRFRDQALVELAKAWTAAAELESSDKMPTPSAYAPSVWRALVDRLLWFEYFCAADFPSNDEAIWRSSVAELQSINLSFADFDSDENIPASGNLVDQLRLARSRLLPPLPIEQTPRQHVSLALVESAAQYYGNRPLPEKISKIIQLGSEYDSVVLTGDDPTPVKLNELLTSKAEELKEIANCYEMQILELRDRPNVPWHLARIALRARRVGEKAAANLLCGDGWARAAIETGDRLRLEGERLIRDQTDRNWEQIARDSLIEALNQYSRATEELRAVRDIIDARSALLSRLPDYFRWAHFGRADRSGNSPKTEDLEKVVSLLAQAGKILSQPGSERIDELANLSARLGEARESLELRLKASNDRWRIETVLRTALPPFRNRRQLRLDLLRGGKEDASDFTRQPPNSAAFQALPIDERRWSAERDEIEAELELARRAGFNREGIELPPSLAGTKSADAPKVLAIDQHYNDLFAASPSASINAEGLTDSKNRPDALVRLRGQMRDWLLSGTEEDAADNLQAGDLFSLLNRAAWYDLLVWQSARSRRALDDASPAEERTLPLLRDTYRKLAGAIQGQPKLDSIAEPQLTLDAANEIHLVRKDKDEEKLTLQVTSSSATDIWLIAEYDSRVLEVDGKGIIKQEELRRAARNSRAAQLEEALYPYRPDIVGAPMTALSANKPHPVELTVRRRTDEHGDTKLILKAVSRDAYVRREVAVGMPGKESFHLAVEALPGLWSERDGGVVLHPLPNRVDHFVFLLSNRASVKKTVNVSFIVPERIPPGDGAGALPRGAPALGEANAILAEYRGEVLIPPLPVEVPASGEAVRFKFTPSPDQKLQANLLPADPAAPDKPPKINLPYGLVVVIEEKVVIEGVETTRKTLRRVLIEPQPPRYYLDAIADIDGAGNVAIRVRATNTAVIPSDGIRISAKIEGISDQFEPKLNGVIAAPTYSAELTGRIAADAASELKAIVDVGDYPNAYPRAFIFHIRRGSARSISPATGTREVRIVSPEPNKSFKATPQAVVPVVLQVDAPHGAFAAGSEVLVGIDSDRDRGLGDENIQPQRLFADRQVNVDATSFAPDGTLTLNTRIGDFSLNLTGNASESPVWVLSQLRVPKQAPESDWVEIKLDGSPPVVERVQLRPGREIEAGKDLDVIISTRDLSRVVKVEATFETSSAGNKESPTAAQPVNDTQWVAKLKTDGLSPGTQHSVIVRTTDEVGHVAEARSGAVQVVAKRGEADQAAEQLMQRKSADIDGVVLFQGKALQAKVQFDPPLSPPIAPVDTNEAGRFTITKVPPGKHTLWARGQKNGYFRNARQEIVVPAEGSATPISVTLNAK
ncbi:MAG TPA: carboxypeptidase-like regulatory domain-containing protein [Lacipirellulaceae bacterium]|nr:carboxypeptidase-like regulatory domain-containing protein [Lacipirellulaceae bacterium]